jgi:N-methylhydantoinase A
MRLDVGRAREVVTRLASTVGLDLDAMALGIHSIMNAQMAEAVRLITVKRGYDPRRFALVAFGGGGPVHAPLVARQLGIAKVIVPHSPGTLSAFGLLVADIEYDAVRAFLCRDEELDPKALEDVFGDLESEGFQRLQDEALPSDRISVRRSVDVRYVGQSFELEIPIAAPASTRSIADCVAGFHRHHEEVFGHADPARPVEFVNVRTVHCIAVPCPEPEPPAAEVESGARRAPTRRVCFEPSTRVDAAVHTRAEVLRSGRVEGPCIIEQADTTTVVYPGMHAVADAAGNVVVWTAS